MKKIEKGKYDTLLIDLIDCVMDPTNGKSEALKDLFEYCGIESSASDYDHYCALVATVNMDLRDGKLKDESELYGLDFETYRKYLAFKYYMNMKLGKTDDNVCRKLFELKKSFEKKHDPAKLKDGAKEVLEKLNRYGYNVVGFTTIGIEDSKNYLKFLDCDDYFTNVVNADMLLNENTDKMLLIGGMYTLHYTTVYKKVDVDAIFISDKKGYRYSKFGTNPIGRIRKFEELPSCLGMRPKEDKRN